MKAFFHRLHIGGSSTKDKDRDPIQKEKFPPLPSWPPEEPQRATSTPTSFSSFKPLPELAPPQLSSSLSARPLPPLAESIQPYVQTPAPAPAPAYSSPTPSIVPVLPVPETGPILALLDQDSSGRSIRKTVEPSSNQTAANDVHKKVAFISPPPTPVNVDRALPDAPAPSLPSPALPLKTTLSRFQATHGKEPRGSISTAASSSKTDVGTPITKPAQKAASTRATSPYLNKPGEGASAASLRSGTPYSQMSNNSSGSRILAAQSWSEVTEEDLVSNLGSRERTRQEVLFEIISSEERCVEVLGLCHSTYSCCRYVQELTKMKDTFIDPLLHPFATSTNVTPLSSTPNLDYNSYRAESPTESGDHLPPIAARFMSPTPSMGPPLASATSSVRNKDAPNIDGESMETDDDYEGDDQIGRTVSPVSKNGHPRSPYRATATRTPVRGAGASVPFPSRSHQSLPPPLSASTHSLGRQSTIVERERERERKQSEESPQKGVLRKFKKSQPSPVTIFGNTLAPHQLPDDLRICLEVVDSGVLDGHKRLSEALKKRYDDQFPLVRSLADVFVSNVSLCPSVLYLIAYVLWQSDIFHGYATYVLHLERALEQVDAALQNVTTKKPKKQDAGEWQKVCKFLQKLEEDACDKGETGLAITLSKPFQRLLKYPLLFQNLLFHTDPSTFEYESTLQMVAEVETIVRSIEDEKIQKEERDKTRDIFARIEGLDKVRQLALPKPSRVLVEERPCTLNVNPLDSSKPSSPPPTVNAKGVKTRSSFKRLSDVLHSGNSGIGGKKDLWFVVFNDVVLQCQRTGTTSLPLVSATNSRTNSLPEFQGKAKYATTGRRNQQTKPRNLYKFIKVSPLHMLSLSCSYFQIETWAIGDVMQPREGVVSMEE